MKGFTDEGVNVLSLPEANKLAHKVWRAGNYPAVRHTCRGGDLVSLPVVDGTDGWEIFSRYSLGKVVPIFWARPPSLSCLL